VVYLPTPHMSLPPFGFEIGSSVTIACAIALVVLAVHLVPYVVDRGGIKTIPGPWLAKFTDAWLGRVAAGGHRSDIVRELHRQYGGSISPVIDSVLGSLPPRFVGTFVRIAPNHVSIADPDAFKVIYAHVTGGLKADFYDAAVPTRPNTFSTRNRAEHSRKRKTVSHAFSLKSVLEYEPCVRLHVSGLLRRWDKLTEDGKKGLSGGEGEGWFGRDGRVWCDTLPCELTPFCRDRVTSFVSPSPGYTYLTFDTISDLAFGSPFGMLEVGTDVLPLAKPRSDGGAKGDVEYFPIFKVVHEHGYYGASLGVLPKWVWPILKKLHPWYRKGGTTAASIAKIAATVVSERFETPVDRVDILDKIMHGKDDEGKLMGRPELIGEALGYLNAGAGTISGYDFRSPPSTTH
jgi:benzoate 4-monooxygenase